jgi:hypothetical protein
MKLGTDTKFAQKSPNWASLQIWCLSLILLLLVTTFSGCALLAIPATIVEGTFGLIGKIFDLVGTLPKPPPGVFYN